MAAETAQKNTPAPVTVAKGGRGSSEVYALIVNRQIVATEQRGVAWKSMPLNEALLINPPTKLLRGETYPFVDMAAITAGQRNVQANQDRIFAGGGSRFQDGDTLMARITPCLENGKIAKFKAAAGASGGHGSTEFIVIRGKPGVSDTDFAYYLATQPVFHAFAVAQMTGTSGRQRVPTKALGAYMVRLPPLAEQKRIASILGALDDKIELNRRMNAKLEDMARTLFKSWFVDFDPVRAKLDGRLPAGMDAATAALFPDAFEESTLGLIPKGWRTGSIYEIAKVIYGAPFASSLFNSEKNGKPLIRIRDLENESPAVFTTEVHPKGYLLHPGDIAVGMDGEFRAHLWAGVESWLNQRVCVFAPKQGYSAAFVRNSIIAPLAHVEATETATTVIHIGKNDIDRFTLLIPDGFVVEAFNRQCQPLYDRIVANKRQRRVFASQRDRLLQKLFSPQLPVNQPNPE